jgi:amino acid transporter
MGFIAGLCAFAYVKLSRCHKPDSNGGSYVFVRAALGKFIGLLVLFLNYILVPLFFSNQILMLCRANFNADMAGSEWFSN